MLKPSPFLSRDVFVTRAPSSTAAGPLCRGAAGEQGNGVPLWSWSNCSFAPFFRALLPEHCYPPLILSLEQATSTWCLPSLKNALEPAEPHF